MKTEYGHKVELTNLNGKTVWDGVRYPIEGYVYYETGNVELMVWKQDGTTKNHNFNLVGNGKEL